MNYTLMHNDDPVAEFTTTAGLAVTKIISEQLLPYLPLSNKTLISNLSEWVMDRRIPDNRVDRNHHKTSEKLELSLKNLGISLTDNYWYKPQGSTLTWKDVDMTRVDFKNDMELNNIYMSKFSPSPTLRGNVQKKWIIDHNGTRQLIKGNVYDEHQVANEVFACMIHKRQNFSNYVEYNIVPLMCDGLTILGSVCPNFIASNEELIHAYEILGQKPKRDTRSDFDFYLDYCAKRGIDGDEHDDFLKYQILTDFAISNNDRHFANFGVIRDARTLKFTRIAPIFDSGNSMLWQCPPDLFEQTLKCKGRIHSWYHNEQSLLKLAQGCKQFHYEALPNAKVVRDFYSYFRLFNGYTVDNLVKLYNIRLSYLHRGRIY